jgi:fructan beta-fructosidase
LWADYGADFYAAQGWNNTPGERSIWAAWMNNWQYANVVPALTSRGSLTLPRELSLTSTPDGIRLRQAPISELQSLRVEPQQWRDVVISPGTNLLDGVSGELLEIRAEFAIAQTVDADRLGFRIRTNQAGDEYTTVGYTLKSQTLFVDRTRSGQEAFDSEFPAVHMAELEPIDGVVRLHILVDRSSIEVFANDGLVTMTDLIFPDSSSIELELFVDGGEVRANSLEVFELRAAGAGM